jgi:hypothetical protein
VAPLCLADAMLLQTPDADLDVVFARLREVSVASQGSPDEETHLRALSLCYILRSAASALCENGLLGAHRKCDADGEADARAVSECRSQTQGRNDLQQQHAKNL